MRPFTIFSIDYSILISPNVAVISLLNVLLSVNSETIQNVVYIFCFHDVRTFSRMQFRPEELEKLNTRY